MKKDSIGLYQRIAWLLPKELIYYCIIRALGHATTGKYSSTEISKITVAETMTRWDK